MGTITGKDPKIPSPADWGWIMSDGNWKPFWTELPQAQKVCYELFSCNCKKACRGLCKCAKASLNCTALCSCGGKCFDES